MRRLCACLVAAATAALVGCGKPRSGTPDAPGAAGSAPGDRAAAAPAPPPPLSMSNHVAKTDAEWRQQLTPEQYRVLREHGTERAFTGPLWNTKEPGAYLCAGCGLELFRSEHKFDSGTGWPSYWQPAAAEHVGTREDRTLFMRRTEVHCARCEGHLGHVFEDGPAPTGLRYCINSAALRFEPARKP